MNWVALGTIQIGDTVFPQVGLAAHSGLFVGPPPPAIAVDFDSVTATGISLTQRYFPFIAR
jgi:hypothetical protein